MYFICRKGLQPLHYPKLVYCNAHQLRVHSERSSRTADVGMRGNRDGLEDCACECYSVIRAETDKFMGPAKTRSGSDA